jgi:AcrR family transcriptional regulator
MGPKRLTRQGKARKEQLMAEAAKLFAQSGYYATRVVDIVKSAGVAKGLFYWYFENKESLFREIVKATRDDLRRAQGKAIEGEADPLVRIVKGISASLKFLSNNKNLYALLRFAGTQEQFASLVEEAQEIHARDTATHIEEAMQSGAIPSGDPMLLGHGVVATVFHFARLRASGAIDVSLQDLSAFASGYSLRALGADPSAYGVRVPTRPLRAVEG